MDIPTNKTSKNYLKHNFRLTFHLTIAPITYKIISYADFLVILT